MWTLPWFLLAAHAAPDANSISELRRHAAAHLGDSGASNRSREELVRDLLQPLAIGDASVRHPLQPGGRRLLMLVGALAEDAVALEYSRLASSRAIARSAPDAIDAAWLEAHVPKMSLVGDYTAILSVDGQCELAQAAYAYVAVSCEGSRRGVCRQAAAGVTRLSGRPPDETLEQAAFQLDYASLAGGPSAICGATLLGAARRMKSQSAKQVAEAVVTELGARCANAIDQ